MKLYSTMNIDNNRSYILYGNKAKTVRSGQSLQKITEREKRSDALKHQNTRQLDSGLSCVLFECSLVETVHEVTFRSRAIASDATRLGNRSSEEIFTRDIGNVGDERRSRLRLRRLARSKDQLAILGSLLCTTELDLSADLRMREDIFGRGSLVPGRMHHPFH